MPADWGSFITNVSNKLDGQTIQASYDSPGRDSDDFSTFLAQQYTNAIVGKAQSPFGNTHVKGREEILINSFSEAFKMLETERSPNFEEKKSDPRYQDLQQEPAPQKSDDQLDKFDLDFLTWTEENSSTLPDFTYYQFFSQFPNFPENEDQQATEVARRILSQFDGSSDYLQWIYTLNLQQDELASFSKKVYDNIIKLTQGLGSEEIKVGDDVQAVTLYDLFPNGLENVARRSRSGSLIRGKISSVSQSNLSLGKSETTYKVFVSIGGRTIERTVDPSTIRKKLKVSDFANVRDVILSKKIMQEVASSDVGRIPSFVTPKFVTRFTYDPRFDTNLFSKIIYTSGPSKTVTNESGTSKIPLTQKEVEQSINELKLAENVLYSGSISNFLDGNIGNINIQNSFLLNFNYINSGSSFTDKRRIKNLFDSIGNLKISRYNLEVPNFLRIKRRYVDSEINKAKKQPDEIDTRDPYEVMANGVVRYWQSCLDRPLTASPPVPPCTIIPPSGGIFTGIYYGSAKSLSNNLRKSFNDGKKFTNQKTGRIVASSLAFSFQEHLAELKFIYNGGIPTPGGPVPSIGFVSTVF